MPKQAKPGKEYQGPYDHLNNDQGNQMKLVIDMDQLADLVTSTNYGTVRLLAALIRARTRQFKKNGWERDGLSDGIKALLENNLF